MCFLYNDLYFFLKIGGFTAISTGFLNIFILLFSLYMAFIRGSAIFALIYGVSKSLLVIRATHACSHYSFSIWQKINRFVYWLCMSCVGDTPAQWTGMYFYYFIYFILFY